MTTAPSLAVRLARGAAVPMAVVVGSTLVWQASNAAFNASTSNGSNSWASGTVAISDDDTGSLMFNVSNLKPGDTGTKCIRVTYNGSLAANVRMYTSAQAGTLGQYLDFTVEQGDGGTFADCTGFSGAVVYSPGTLNGFNTTHTSFGTGAGTWAPTGAAQTKTYRVTYTLQDNNAAQGLTANATFTWEAQNS